MLLLSHIQPDSTVLNQLVRDRAGLQGEPLAAFAVEHIDGQYYCPFKCLLFL